MVNGVNDLKVQLRNRSRGETFNDAMSFRMSQKHREKLSALSVKYDADMGSIIRALISLFSDDEFDADVRGVVVSNSGTIEHPLNLKMDLMGSKIEALLSSVGDLSAARPLEPIAFSSDNYPSIPPYEVLLDMAQMTKGDGDCPLGAFLVKANTWLPERVPARFLYRNHSWFGINEVLHFIGIVYPYGFDVFYPPKPSSFPECPSRIQRYDDAKGRYFSDFVEGWESNWTGGRWYGHWYCISRMKNEGSLERFVRSIHFDLYAAAARFEGNGESLRKGLEWKRVGSKPDHWFGNLSFVDKDGKPIEIESTYIV